MNINFIFYLLIYLFDKFILKKQCSIENLDWFNNK
jgi:hypothetical protein